VKDIETVRRVFDSTKNHQNARLWWPGEIRIFFFISNSATTTTTRFSDTSERTRLDEDLQPDKIWLLIDKHVRRCSRYRSKHIDNLIDPNFNVLHLDHFMAYLSLTWAHKWCMLLPSLTFVNHKKNIQLF
jgi:hypothetical protein